MLDLMSLTTLFIQWANSLVLAWGYLGLFIVELVGSMSIFFPVPGFAVNFLLGGMPGFNPWLVGIVAGTGSAIGEMTSYLIGAGGREVLENKYQKKLERARKWIEKHGAFIVIIIFASTPLPFDIVGLLAGMIRYDIKKFFLATLIGKLIAGIVLAWAGYYSIGWVLSAFSHSPVQNVTGAVTVIPL